MVIVIRNQGVSAEKAVWTDGDLCGTQRGSAKAAAIADFDSSCTCHRR
jgi:hypothetical protein